MLYLLGWLRKRFSKQVNKSYPSSKNSSADEDSKIISHSFSHHFNQNIKLSKNSKLIPYDLITTSKYLNIMYRVLDFKTPELYNIFFSMQKKTEENNFYNYVNKLCSYRR